MCERNFIGNFYSLRIDSVAFCDAACFSQNYLGCLLLLLFFERCDDLKDPVRFSLFVLSRSRSLSSGCCFILYISLPWNVCWTQFFLSSLWSWCGCNDSFSLCVDVSLNLYIYIFLYCSIIWFYADLSLRPRDETANWENEGERKLSLILVDFHFKLQRCWRIQFETKINI